MVENINKCRICLDESQNDIIALQTKIPDDQSLTYAQIYQNLSGLVPDKGSQVLCNICTGNLLNSYGFKKKIIQCESVWDVEIKVENDLEEVEIKPDTDDMLFVSTIMTPDDVVNVLTQSTECKSEVDTNELDFNWSDQEQNDKNGESSTNDGNSDKDQDDESEDEKGYKEECLYCKKMYRDKKDLLKHCRKNHPDKKLQCSDCDTSYRLPYQLKKHRRQVHSESDIEESLKKIKNSSNKSKSSRSKYFECPWCPESFKKKHHLTQHKKDQHKGKRSNKKDVNNEKTICPHCGLLLFAKSLDKHTKRVHQKTRDELYICDLCGAKVTSRNGIISHMQLKHLNVAYICRHCPEVFQNPGTRRTHEIRFHTLKYNFACHICGKKFLTGVYLRKHLNSHTGERKHTCEVCGMALATKESLKHHMATHSDARPYSCEICAATFKTTQTLRVHRKSHKEWDYECPVCQRKFLVNQQLRQHVTKNHPAYELPPPGTVMNKSALRRIQEIKEKYNSDNVTVEMLGSFCKRRDYNRYGLMNINKNNVQNQMQPPQQQQQQMQSQINQFNTSLPAQQGNML